LYVASPTKGVFKSADGGATWLNISTGLTDVFTGITLNVSDLCLFKGKLFASTSGSNGVSIYKLDSLGRNRWLPFSNGLSALSINLNCIIGTSNTLVAGTNANGLYDYLPPNSTTWEERFLTNPISVNEAPFDIITAHDTLFLPGKTGLFYMSTDNGLTWSVFGDRLVTGASFIVNAKQALISSRYIFDGVSNTSLYYYIKKDELQNPFINFSILRNLFTWKIDIIGDNLWAATDRGLFFMPLSILPGITAADDSTNLSPLPVHFISVGATCNNSHVLITWNTAQEDNISRFGIERSNDSNHWVEIGSMSTKAAGINGTAYTFNDNEPLQTAYYRIAEHDADGHIHYSSLFRSLCTQAEVIGVWPNPVKERMFISISAIIPTPASISLFDARAALVKKENVKLVAGKNLIEFNMQNIPRGIYSVVVTVDGELQKAVQVMKQ
jgi:hypothetical protein